MSEQPDTPRIDLEKMTPVECEPSNAELIADVENTFVLLKPSKARLLAARLKEAEARLGLRERQIEVLCADRDRLRSELESAKASGEAYAPGWKRLVCMVSPTGEIHAVGGECEPGEGDMPYPGLERIKAAAAEREKRMRLVLEGIIRDCESCDGTGMGGDADAGRKQERLS